MSFHVIPKRQHAFSTWSRSYARRVALKVYTSDNRRRLHITISGDLLAHLCARPGDFVRPLIGFGEDQGDFAIEKVTHRRDGYTVNAQFYARSMFFRVRADHFVPLTSGVVHTFDIELVEGRVICRAPVALAQAAE